MLLMLPLQLLLALHSKDLAVRLWPGPFMYNSERDVLGRNQGSMRLIYLIGITTSASVPMRPLQDFEDMITQSSYYDSAEAFLCINAVERADLGANLVLADQLAATDTDQDDDDTVTENDEPMTTITSPAEVGKHEHEAFPIERELEEFLLRGKKPKKPKLQARTRSGAEINESNSPLSSLQSPEAAYRKVKLRTSADVYNRLLWDPTVNAIDYVIGYEDRFLGYQEIALTSWKRDVDDEAFVSAFLVVLPVSESVFRYHFTALFASSGGQTTSSYGIGKQESTLSLTTKAMKYEITLLQHVYSPYAVL
jgi:hypothetical protein